MKKVFLMAIISLVCLGIQAQIKPQSRGVQETKMIGGFTDIFVKMGYRPDLGYIFILRSVSVDVYMNVPLGKTEVEALESCKTLLDILENGKKNEVFDITETISMMKKNNSRLNFYETGFPDYGYVQARHLRSAIDYLNSKK